MHPNTTKTHTMKTHTLKTRYANPVDDGGPVTLDRAREIVREDPSLIYAHETY